LFKDKRAVEKGMVTVDEAITLLEFSLTDEADEESLKKQFKKMVLKYHPDRNQNQGATEKFIKIKDAHDLLQQVLAQRKPVYQPQAQQFDFGTFSINPTATSSTGFSWSIHFG